MSTRVRGPRDISMYYDIDGNELVPANADYGSPAWDAGRDAWCKLIEDPDYKRIGLTTVDRWQVSTVFLGLDHNYSADGPPILFETMIFDLDNDGVWRNGEDRYMRRYHTKYEAALGHERIVLLVAKGRLPKVKRTLRERIKCWARRLLPEWAWLHRVASDPSPPAKECEREQE